VSSTYHATDLEGGFSARRFWKELPVRALYGALLALATVGATLIGGYFFVAFVAVVAVAAAREWHRMVGAQHFGREAAIASLAIVTALCVTPGSSGVALPLFVVGAGALLAAGASALQNAPPFLGGLGTLYIGIPASSVVALRSSHTPDAQWVVLGIFLVVWTADTGAMLAGQLLRGPKLSPHLSPNKTWSGLCGGLVLPALAAAAYVGIFRGNAWIGMAAGFVLALAGHAGDLFESWVKRRVGRKDSGELIPGHGGILDRIDSALFVMPLAAILFHYFGPSELFRVAP